MALFQRALAQGSIKHAFAPAGQVTGLIRDIPDCKTLIERTVAEAEQVIRDMNARNL
jgi:NAD(P)H-dependent flavin oxidoreductase YrpB (nitropropane dioxygenase family)